MNEKFKKNILREFTFYVSHEANPQTKLLHFHSGRQRCRKRLLEVSKKEKVAVLNYHISPDKLQILAWANSDKITTLIKNVASSVAGDRKRFHNIEGPFWRKRYKSALVQNGVHLLRCNLTMDMTMVLQKTCTRPEEWAFSGYHEIVGIRKRYRVINCDKAAQLSGFENYALMKIWYLEHMNAIPEITILNPEDLTTAVAVGDFEHLKLIASCFSNKHRRREIKLLVKDKFGSTYGLFVAQKAKLAFSRSLK